MFLLVRRLKDNCGSLLQQLFISPFRFNASTECSANDLGEEEAAVAAAVEECERVIMG